MKQKKYALFYISKEFTAISEKQYDSDSGMEGMLFYPKFTQ